ncbi:MAG: bifunctional DNase/RNase [Candidatus Omnitrophota bacterium]|jgi:bifunctional DNase/RNase
MKKARISSLVSLFPLPQYVVVLEDEDKSHLVPIWIGVNEGNAISLEMNGEKFPRPLTHDLMANIFKSIGAKVNKVVITDIKDNSYFAEMEITIHDKVYNIDARPSDSLAIAVRVECPIYISQLVLDKCPSVDQPISETEVDAFKDELKYLTPEEFFNRLESAPAKMKEIDQVLGPVNLDFDEGEDEDGEGEDDLADPYGEDDEDFDEDDEDFDDEDEEEDPPEKPL